MASVAALVRRRSQSAVVEEEVVVERGRPRVVVRCASWVVNQNRQMARWKSSLQQERVGHHDSLLGCKRRKRIYRFHCVHNRSSGKSSCLDEEVRGSWVGDKVDGRMGPSDLEVQRVRLSEVEEVGVQSDLMMSELQKEGGDMVGKGELGCEGSCESGSKRVHSRIGDASMLREVVESTHLRVDLSCRPEHQSRPRSST